MKELHDKNATKRRERECAPRYKGKMATLEMASLEMTSRKIL